MPAVTLHRRIPREVVSAAACGLAALALYLWTLQPGSGGPEDSPKFQCLGYVLGTAHPPGYPLYTILTYVVSHIPIRSIAWRANAFSALCGAVSIAFVWGAARQLGASRVAAAGAALGLAFGAYFWWNAILAEVYTLGTALEAAMLFFLLRWQRTRRVADLHAAVAAAAFALGNHLTIVALAPACLLFAVVVDWRQALRPRTVALNLLLGVVGLSTYSYILIRTWMGGAYLEARATNLSELFTVMRASRFSGSMFGVTATNLFLHRLPQMFGELQRQVTVAGAILAIAGLVFLAWKSWRAALLVAGGLLGALMLAAEVEADIKGFLMPALVLSWLLSAAGLDAIERAIGAVAGPRAALVTAAAIAVFVPGRLLAMNYDANNLRNNTFQARYLDALFDRLPPGSTVVAENYVVNSLITCERIVRGRTSNESLELIPASPSAIRAMKVAGRGVFAFEDGANAAIVAGYRVTPLELQDTSLRARLDSLPSRSVIVIAAAQRGIPVDLASRSGPAARAWRAAQKQQHHVIVLAPGRWDAAQFTSADAPIDRRLEAGTTLAGGGRMPVDARALAEGDRAAVSVRGRQVASAYDGMVVVAIGPDGKVVGSWTYAAGAPLIVPLDMARWPVFEVESQRECRAVGDGAWHDVSDVAGQGALFVRFDNARPALARLSLYVLAAREPAPAVRPLLGSPAPTVDQRLFDRSIPKDAAALATVLAAEGVRLDPGLHEARFVARDELSVDDRGDQAHAGVYLGGRPLQVLARGRTDRMTAPRVLVCEEAIPPVVTGSAMAASTLPIGPSTPFYFGAGWRRAERADDVGAPHRWTGGPSARLVVPVEAALPLRIELHLRPAQRVTRIAASLNGHPLAWQALSEDWQDVSWETDASMWQRGLNDLTLMTDRVHDAEGSGADRRAARGIDVARIQFVRRPPS